MAFYILTVLIVAFDLYSHHQIIINAELDFDEEVAQYTAFITNANCVLPFISFIEGKKIAQYLSNWAKFEVEYYKLIKKRLVYKIRNLQYVFVAYLIVCWILFLSGFIPLLLENRDSYKLKISPTVFAVAVLSKIYFMSIINLLLAEWIFLNLGIRKAARILLQDLKVLNKPNFRNNYCFICLF